MYVRTYIHTYHVQTCTYVCTHTHIHVCTHAHHNIHPYFTQHTCNFILSCSYRSTSSLSYLAETRMSTVRRAARRRCRTRTVATARARRVIATTQCPPLATRWRSATGHSIPCATRTRCSHHVIAVSAPVHASLSRTVAKETALTRADLSVDSSVELAGVRTQSERIPRKCPFRKGRTVAVVPIVVRLINQTTNVLMPVRITTLFKEHCQ